MWMAGRCENYTRGSTAPRRRPRPRLGKPQCERHQPLLSARAVETQIALVHLDQEIVAMRPDHRLASPRLLDEVLVERGQDVGLGRVRRESPAVSQGHVPRSGQRRVERAGLLLEGLQRAAASGHQLEADPRELLAPWGERAAERGTRHPALEQMIAPRQDLAVASEATQVSRVELAREAVDEVAARLRPLGQDREILPAEADRARPGTAFAADTPATVLALDDGAAHHAHRVTPPDLASHDRAGRVPAEHVRPLPASN